MGLRDFFKPVPTWSADQVREFLKGQNPAEFNLVDVREPSEYEKEHLPGARHIPLAQLARRIRELDREKPTIAY